MDHNARQNTRAGLPSSWSSECKGLHEPTQDGTQTKDTHPVPEHRLKLLTPTGYEAGCGVGMQGLYRPRHGRIINQIKTTKIERSGFI